MPIRVSCSSTISSSCDVTNTSGRARQARAGRPRHITALTTFLQVCKMSARAVSCRHSTLNTVMYTPARHYTLGRRVKTDVSCEAVLPHSLSAAHVHKTDPQLSTRFKGKTSTKHEGENLNFYTRGTIRVALMFKTSSDLFEITFNDKTSIR